jgi:hypothetical protein
MPTMSHVAAGPRRRVRCVLCGVEDGVVIMAERMADQITTALTLLKNLKYRSRFRLTDKDRQYIQVHPRQGHRHHPLPRH